MATGMNIYTGVEDKLLHTQCSRCKFPELACSDTQMQIHIDTHKHRQTHKYRHTHKHKNEYRNKYTHTHTSKQKHGGNTVIKKKKTHKSK